MGSTSTLKLTKFYKLRDGSSLGLNGKNYEECAKILFSYRTHIKIREKIEKKMLFGIKKRPKIIYKCINYRLENVLL